MNVFILRRDFRIIDNIALNKMPQNEPITLVFVLNPEQVNAKLNKYYSENCVRFMIESLQELNKSIDNKIVFLKSDKDIFKLGDIKTIGFNQDVTPYARKRDEELKTLCKSKNIEIITDDFDEYLLIPLKNMVGPSLKYSSFYNKYKNHKPITETRKFTFTKPLSTKANKLSIKLPVIKDNIHANVHGGRENALKILKRIENKEFKKYGSERNAPFVPTTYLSAYLKFGCISLREAHNAFIQSGSEELLKELYWRGFYDQIAYYHPKVLGGQINKTNTSFYEKFDNIKWSNNQKLFDLWTQGTTGFPLVDAGIRQLNQTGYMHNRVRMVVASLLVKNLHIDWRKGEQYFATKLIDYHPTANNGGWTFVTGNGANAQFYYRTFNPFLQSEKFDKEAIYIKQWVPELADVKAKDIHRWDDRHKKYDVNYPSPCIDHRKEAAIALKQYKEAIV
jgi:deoxyribodipyrimidine photo-lyase